MNILQLIRDHSLSSPMDRIARLIVLACKQDAGTTTLMDLIELSIIQEIRNLKGELAERDSNFENE